MSAKTNITGGEDQAQKLWRPWNGFWFAPTVFCIYFVLPLLGKTVPAVPEWVWIGWLTVLGVTSWGRNQLKMKQAAKGNDGDGPV